MTSTRPRNSRSHWQNRWIKRRNTRQNLNKVLQCKPHLKLQKASMPPNSRNRCVCSRHNSKVKRLQKLRKVTDKLSVILARLLLTERIIPRVPSGTTVSILNIKKGRGARTALAKADLSQKKKK